jgi:hypothetical protein
MAQAGYTPISLYYSTTAAAVPTAGNLVAGELAINIVDGKLYYENSSGVVTLLAGAGGAGIVAGSNTQLQFNNSGVFGASANLTWDGTTLSSTQVNITGQGTLRLQDTTGGEYVALRAPASLAGNYTLTFPADDGTSGQALITDGSGVLSWSTAASGDVYGPASATANGIALFDGTTGKLLKDSAATDGLIRGMTIGRGAGGVATNTAVGASVLAANTIGASNTAFGDNALVVNTTGSNNQAFGRGALSSNIDGGQNVAVGRLTLGANTSGPDNSAVGYNAIYSNTTGGYNTAVGAFALYSNTSASANTAQGWQALYNNTTASNNTAVGYQAAYSNTTGPANTAVGYLAGYSGTTTTGVTSIGGYAGYTNTSSHNTFLGYAVGYYNTTGSYNTFVGGYGAAGFGTGYYNTTGSYNVAVGQEALKSNTTADLNTAVGYQAAYSNTTGVDNVAIGAGALYSNTTGIYNTAVGYRSMSQNSTANDNSAYGFYSLYYNTTGAQNTAVGRSALFNNTTASYNTAVGYQAGYSMTVSSAGAGGNLFMGYQAGYTTSTGRYNTFVGHQAGLYSSSSNGNNAFFGNSSGSLITTGYNNTIIGRYDGNQDGLDIRTADAYVVLSDGDGNRQITMKEGQTLALDSAVPNSGTGITFPATQSASSNANTLDDYEEGTFTPVISGTSTAGTGTYTQQVGAYVKIGKVVQYQIYIILTAHTGTGDIAIGGLPFTASAGFYPPAAIYVNNLALTALNYPQIAVSTSSTDFLVRQVSVGGGATSAIPMDTAFDILLSGTYQV